MLAIVEFCWNPLYRVVRINLTTDRTHASTTSARSRLAALREKKPGTKAAQLRALWPEIKLALDSGHSLKVICDCLAADGITVTEKSLAVYIGRIRKRTVQKAVGTPGATAVIAATLTREQREQNASSAGTAAKKPRDPLANVRERQAKRPGFDYRPELADPKELI